VELRGEGEGIDVDTNSGAVSVMLVRLNFVEVTALAHLETIMTVELEESTDYRVLTSETFKGSHGVTRDSHGAIPVVRVVEGLLTLPGVDYSIIARDERITLYNPDELLNGVVEVELNLVGRRGNRFATSELENLDEVLMGHLGELAALFSIKEDIINVERSSLETLGIHAITDSMHVRGRRSGGVIPAEIAEIVELEVDTDFVVLESNERESKARVAAEPELKGNVESVFRSARTDGRGLVGDTSIAIRIASSTTLTDDVGELGDVTNHLGIHSLLTRLLGELIPDVEPVTIMLINALTTNFKFYGLDKVVANPVEPTELSTRTIRSEDLYLRENSLEVDTVDKITSALDSAGNLLTEVGGTIERIFDGLHGEVGVTTIHDLPESNLRITG
jgi:hypothetical protein